MADTPPIRDAATVILVRRVQDQPHVLMGQRGAKAVFMPSKFVFPGGAVDPGDGAVPLAGTPDATCMARLGEGVPDTLPQALVAAAIRETWEETGLRMGTPVTWQDPPQDWADFASSGLRPSGEALRFVFRAITPPGRPRRFDARFFLAEAEACVGDVTDFSAASDELSQLQWIPLPEVRKFDLPFITKIVLAEVNAFLQSGARLPDSVPFFHNDDEATTFRRLQAAGQV